MCPKNNCTDEDKQDAKEKGGGPSEEAYLFAVKIQNLISKKDMKGLFDLVDGELDWGPRRDFAINSKFEDIFDKSWLKEVIEYKPPCTPFAWRGYNISEGKIWFIKYKGEWRIFGINGAKKEKFQTISGGWFVEDKLMSPECFKFEKQKKNGDTINSYKEYSNYFKISDYQDFRKKPGKYFGSEIENFDPINSNISLIKNISECSFESKQINDKIYKEINSNHRHISIYDDKIMYTVEYEILHPIQVEICNNLVPSLNAECEKSYLIRFSEDWGGTIGPDTNYTIFGLFNLEGSSSLLPLINFGSENDALQFIFN